MRPYKKYLRNNKISSLDHLSQIIFDGIDLLDDEYTDFFCHLEYGDDLEEHPQKAFFDIVEDFFQEDLIKIWVDGNELLLLYWDDSGDRHVASWSGSIEECREDYLPTFGK